MANNPSKNALDVLILYCMEDLKLYLYKEALLH